MSKSRGGYGVRCSCGLHCTVTYRWEANRDRDEHKHHNPGHNPIIWKTGATGHWQYEIVPQRRESKS